MKFRSNRCIAVHLKNLSKAERFYGHILGFKLKKKTKDSLEYDTGLLRLYVNRSSTGRPPVPSFSVRSVAKARRLIEGAGCKIVADGEKAFYFRDPFGFVFDVIED
ncbi:MAG TPA: VOC family protein [Opitutaceae bacterium]|jgi:catechol 2,3-dioxygenase-like lactoylglutathione lyase family enzyme